MIIMTQASFPPSRSKELGKAFQDLPEMPDYITMRGPYIQGSEKKGIRSVAIYEIDNSRLAEALEHVGNRMVPYFGVEGFRYTIEVWYETLEALKMVGLE